MLAWLVGVFRERFELAFLLMLELMGIPLRCVF